MNIWRFYKIPDIKDGERPRDVHIMDAYPLYAVTNKKKLAKQFMEERNMNVFIMKKSKAELDEYSVFANQHRGAVLKKYALITSTDHRTIENIRVLMTENEYQNVKEPMFNLIDEEWWLQNGINPYVFNSNIEDALRFLDYIRNYKIYFSQSFTNIIKPIDDDYDAPDWFIDEVAYFIALFKYTFPD